MTLDLFIASLVGALIGALIVLLGVFVNHYINNISTSITQLETENKDMQNRLKDLEAVKERSRQTGATMAGLEDAMASLVGIIYNRDIDNHRLDATLRMLQQLRQGPYAYDSEKPSENRKDYQ